MTVVMTIQPTWIRVSPSGRAADRSGPPRVARHITKA